MIICYCWSNPYLCWTLWYKVYDFTTTQFYHCPTSIILMSVGSELFENICLLEAVVWGYSFVIILVIQNRKRCNSCFQVFIQVSLSFKLKDLEDSKKKESKIMNTKVVQAWMFTFHGKRYHNKLWILKSREIPLDYKIKPKTTFLLTDLLTHPYNIPFLHFICICYHGFLIWNSFILFYAEKIDNSHFPLVYLISVFFCFIA